jgi:hypothetical protein
MTLRSSTPGSRSALRTLALGLGIASILVLAQACSEDTSPVEAATSGVSTSAGSGASGGAGGGAVGSGGDGGEGGMGGMSPFGPACDAICDEIDAIDCVSWPNCQVECPGAFNSPPECADEYQAMIDCWVLHKDELMCTQTQVLPPPSCAAEQETFNLCFGGGGGTTCAGQVCNTAETTCACKTACLDSEFKSACADQNGTWACSCYNHEQLLGNCTEIEANACNNFMGCCADFFYPQK